MFVEAIELLEWRDISVARRYLPFFISALIVSFILLKWLQWHILVRQMNQFFGIPSGYFGPIGNIYIITAGMKMGWTPAICNALMGLSLTHPFNQHKGFIRTWMGAVPFLAAWTPEAAETVLSSNHIIEKSSFYEFVHDWLGLGLLTSGGQKWRSHRKMLTPSFHFKILEDFLPIMTKETKIFIDVLQQAAAKNDGIIEDVSNPILMCALDTICETAMGVTVNAQLDPENKYVRAVHQAGVFVLERFSNPIYNSSFIYSLTNHYRKYQAKLSVLHEFTNQAIESRKKQILLEIEDGTFKERKSMVFMDTLIYQHIKDPISLTQENIREEVDTFMFEGHDTTGWAVTWATYLVGLHPEVQEKIHEELDQVFGLDFERDYTMDDLRALKYLECVVKEALRLYPSVPFYGRTTTKPTEIEGRIVPAGVQVGVMSFIIHRCPRHWPEPEKFKPERFTFENSIGRHPYAFVPFSAGPRNCIGQKFAHLEEKAMLASLFRRFKVTSLVPRDKIRILPAMVLKCQQQLKVQLEKRN